MTPFMLRHPHKIAAVWRSVKEYDIDKNGFLQDHELEGCFREHFAPELDGKSLIYFFRRFSTDHDKELINYRLIRGQLVAKMNQGQNLLNNTMQRQQDIAAELSPDQSNRGLGYNSNNLKAFDSFVNKPFQHGREEEDDEYDNKSMLPKLSIANVHTIDQDQ